MDKENKEENNEQEFDEIQCCCCWPKPKKPIRGQKYVVEQSIEAQDDGAEETWVDARQIVYVARLLNILTFLYLLAIIIVVSASMKQFNEVRRVVEPLSKPAMLVFSINVIELIFSLGKLLCIIFDYEWQDMAIFFEIVVLCVGCVHSVESMIRMSNSEIQLEGSIVQKMQVMFILQAAHFFLHLFGLVFYCCSDTKFADEPRFEERAKNLERPPPPRFNDLPESFKHENNKQFKQFMKNEGHRELQDFEFHRQNMNHEKDRQL